MKYYIAKPRLPSQYQEVEYIESDGNQFIDVGVKDSTTIDFAFKIYPEVHLTVEAMLQKMQILDFFRLMDYILRTLAEYVCVI